MAEEFAQRAGKEPHLIDLKREHLIDQVCTQEVLPPEKWAN
jgi:hypothetical protein